MSIYQIFTCELSEKTDSFYFSMLKLIFKWNSPSLHGMKISFIPLFTLSHVPSVFASVTLSALSVYIL